MAYDLTRSKSSDTATGFPYSVNAVALAADHAELNLPPIAIRKVEIRRAVETIAASLVTALTFIALVFGIAVGMSVAALGLAFFLVPVTTSLAAATALVFLGLCFRHHVMDKTKSIFAKASAQDVPA
ncbi:MAG: hypothetical protein ABWZ40_08315 [Caulobacterales bacterium]